MAVSGADLLMLQVRCASVPDLLPAHGKPAFWLQIRAHAISPASGEASFATLPVACKTYYPPSFIKTFASAAKTCVRTQPADGRPLAPPPSGWVP